MLVFLKRVPVAAIFGLRDFFEQAKHRVSYTIEERMWRVSSGGLLQNHRSSVLWGSSRRGGIVGIAMELAYVVVETPMGPFTVGASESAVHKAYFGKPAASVSLSRLSHAKQPVLAMQAKEQVEQYLAGKRSTFFLPLAVHGMCEWPEPRVPHRSVPPSCRQERHPDRLRLRTRRQEKLARLRGEIISRHRLSMRSKLFV